jgi:hypothetical protein
MRNEKIGPRSNKLSHQLREPVVPFLCPTKLDGNVAALNIAEVTKACFECIYCAGRARWRRRAKEAEARHRAGQALRSERRRQCSSRAAQ